MSRPGPSSLLWQERSDARRKRSGGEFGKPSGMRESAKDLPRTSARSLSGCSARIGSTRRRTRSSGCPEAYFAKRACSLRSSTATNDGRLHRPSSGHRGSRVDLQDPAVRSLGVLWRKRQSAAPELRSPRQKADDAWRAAIRRVWEDNFAVHGARKVWRRLRREGHGVARAPSSV
jgi:hypothetical protein